MTIRKIAVLLFAFGTFLFSSVGMAQGKTEVKLLSFLGECDAEFGKVIDASKANGVCGIMTALINEFNATNTQGIFVKAQNAEWASMYDQLSSSIAAKDAPAISLMHESVLTDYVSHNLLDPLDEGFKSVGLQTSEFTEHGKLGTTLNGKSYAMPFDTHAWLWHINTNLLKKAGLTKPDGSPVLPKSPEELLVHARRVKQATGKPYFAWFPGDGASDYRSLITLVAQQNTRLFSANGHQIDMHSKAVTNALELMNTLSKEGLMATGKEETSGNLAFETGNAAVRVFGDWRMEVFLLMASKDDSPLKGGYVAVPFAQLYGRKAVWADGHSWVMPRGGAKDEKTRKAALTFLKFLWDRNYEWARTGLLPANRTAFKRVDFQKLPMRSNIMEIGRIAVPVPVNTPRQRAIQGIVGEEIALMLTEGKPMEAVQRDAEKRVNKLLASLQSK